VHQTDQNAALYDKRWVSRQDMKIYGPASRWLRSLITSCGKHMAAGEVSTILDVGCGEGSNTAHIAQMFPGATVKGIDFSTTAISHAQNFWHTPNVSFSHDPHNKALDSTFDLICCFEVLEHVEKWHSLVDQMCRSSQRYLLISFPTGTMRPFEKKIGHVRNFKKGAMESKLFEQGFKPIEIRYAGFPFYSPFYRNMCNIFDTSSHPATTGHYGFSRIALAHFIYLLFRWCSSQKHIGDQFCGLFQKSSAEYDV
jgi:SAM-dependent methyltransferase